MGTVGPAVRSVWPTVASLCLVQFVDVLGVTVVVTALPSMLADLHASTTQGGLVVTGYAMFFGALLMLGARLGDRYGHRRTILVSLVVFAFAAVLAATAGSVQLLTAARCLQGAAAAASVPSALRLLTSVAGSEAQRHKAIAAWSAAGATAGAGGFVVGGVVSDLASWRAVFWGYLPLAVALVAAIARFVPGDRDADPTISLNLGGTAAFTATVMAFVVGASIVTEPGLGAAGTASLLASAVLVVVFVVVDRRAAAPLLPGAVLRVRRVSHGTVGALLNTLTTGSVLTLVTLYLQDTQGRRPLAAAALLLPVSVAAICGSALSGQLLRRLSPHLVVTTGLGIIAAADLVLIWAAPTPWALAVCVSAVGIGLGMSSVATTALGTDIETVWRATASGINNTAAQLGAALGIAVLLLVADASGRTPEPGVPVPALAWALAAAVAATGAVAFATWDRRARA